MARTLVVVGLALVVLGLLWPVIGKLGLGRLPGDILVQRPGFQLYIPITTCVIVSAALSAIVWLLNR